MGRKLKVHENRSIRRHQDGVISLKALGFRAFADLEEKQLRGAESSVEIYPKLASKTPCHED
jgi:hypothetical protein